MALWVSLYKDRCGRWLWLSIVSALEKGAGSRAQCKVWLPPHRLVVSVIHCISFGRMVGWKVKGFEFCPVLLHWSKLATQTSAVVPELLPCFDAALQGNCPGQTRAEEPETCTDKRSQANCNTRRSFGVDTNQEEHAARNGPVCETSEPDRPLARGPYVFA